MVLKIQIAPDKLEIELNRVEQLKDRSFVKFLYKGLIWTRVEQFANILN